MKLYNDKSIYVGNSGSSDSVNLATFLTLPQSQTQLGILLIQLLAENTWSENFEIIAHIYPNESESINRLSITGANLQSRDTFKTLPITEDSEIKTVNDVAHAIIISSEIYSASLITAIETLQQDENRERTKKETLIATLAKNRILTKLPNVQLEQIGGSLMNEHIYFRDSENNRVIFMVYRDITKNGEIPIYETIYRKGDTQYSYLNHESEENCIKNSHVLELIPVE